VNANYTPILIVGGGPVGLVLAIDLALQGVPCALVNDGETTAQHPQGNTMNARTMEHYRRLGVSKTVRETGLPFDHPTDSAYFTHLNGFEITRFRMPSAEEKMRHGSPDLKITPEPLHRVSQMLVEAILKQRADDLPHSTMRFGWRLNGFEQDGDGVTAEIEEVASGRQESLRCDYLVGCDGGRSTVRQSLGIRYHGEGGEELNYMMGRMQSTYIEAPGIYNVLKSQKSFHFQITNPEFRGAFITLDGKGKFLVFSKLDPGAEISTEKTHAFIQKAIGAEVPVKILSAKPWSAGQGLVADRYGEGRVFLAGDAVHLFTPTGGFGMNTGIDDAANLAWKLAACHHGWGGPGLLESYEAERRPIGIRNTSESFRMARHVSNLKVPEAIEEDSPAGEQARTEVAAYLQDNLPELFAAQGIQLGARYDGSPLVAPDGTDPPPDTAADYVPTACPGGRAPHAWLADGSPLFDHFGRGFTLLRLGGTQADTGGLERAAETRGIPLQVVDIEAPEVRGIYERDLALIRPDQHVAWRGDEAPSDPEALLARITGTEPGN
jgi:2-polyprenyl-6-methoxyphenol hydroxylase-like FAD-dependent oxidoreductase